ncbi:MAG: serine protease [Planctomycetia bacterium]|nr:serine protease [Planctomycetia bacterium]
MTIEKRYSFLSLVKTLPYQLRIGKLCENPSVLTTQLLFCCFILFCSLIFANDSDAIKNENSKIGASGSEFPGDMSTVLHRYPAFARIISQGHSVKTKELESTSFYYGSGVYVAEQGEYGIVLTNAHVISEAEGKIQVKFPNFSSEGVVLLVDEVWDIAALIIHKPPFLPVPITLEVPLIGEKLWLAGFGQNHDLSGFQMISGTVYKYATIELYPDLPAETLMIEPGIRNGDSGGPILNQYGELAGLIWGSVGSITTGTFSLRLQAFLTQTQFQLKNMDSTVNDFWDSLRQMKPKRILMASTPAQKALKTSGVYPISSLPIYHDTNALLNKSAVPAAFSNDFYPPYPAKLSPTYIALKNAIGHEHPEVYLASDSTKQTQENVADISELTTLSVSNTTNRYPLENLVDSRENSPDSSQTLPPYAAPYNETENPLSSPETESVDASEIIVESQNETNPVQTEQKLPINNPKENSTTNIQIIIVVVFVFFLFFNAVRLLALARKKDE